MVLSARARDDQHAARLYELGATDAVPENVEASLQLAENILVDIGVPMGLVIASIHEKRDEYRALFRSKIEGDREPRAVRAGEGEARSRLGAPG
jgi:CPA2 family monovalent cation:H+ antiporter-2